MTMGITILLIFEQVRFPLFPVYLTTGFPVIFVNPHLVQSHSHCLQSQVVTG